jgi:hypothetical protein
MVEALLTVRVSGFFNFGTELVYRLDSKWRFLRASTFFRFQDFEELHRKVLQSITDCYCMYSSSSTAMLHSCVYNYM